MREDYLSPWAAKPNTPFHRGTATNSVGKKTVRFWRVDTDKAWERNIDYFTRKSDNVQLWYTNL